MSRVRRVKPSTREGRRRAAELQYIIRRARSSKAEREEARKELNAIAPVEGSGFVGVPIGAMGPKPDTVALLSLCDRVDAKRGGSSSPAEGPAGLEAFLATMYSPEQVAADRERVVRRAQNASAGERALALLSEPEHAGHKLNVLAKEIAQWLWTEDRAVPRPEPAPEGIVAGWLRREPYNRWDLRGQPVVTVVDDVFRLLAARDAAEPGWFVRRAERLFDAPEVPAKPEPTAVPEPQTEKPEPVGEPPEPLQTPTPCAEADITQRVDLILRVIDPNFLGRLAAYSPTYDSAIRAALTSQLLAGGGVDGVWLANLYNPQRPKGVSAFPARTF